MSKPKRRYNKVGLGGTFDHFHDGHKHFIDFSAQQGQELIIGVTDPRMTKHKIFSSAIQTYHQRTKAVASYCQSTGVRFSITRLTDIYGPAIERGIVEALCVTSETVPGAEKINQIRNASKLPELPVYICDMILDETGQELHADKIRQGVVNRQGIVYLHHLQQDIILSDEQRHQLQKPLGKLMDQPDVDQADDLPVVVVGDSSLEKFMQQGWRYDLAVYDLHNLRQPITNSDIINLKPNWQAKNPAGSVTQELLRQINNWMTKFATTGKQLSPQYLRVDGEEDLATLAVILTTPLGTSIYYGQPKAGMVAVTVTEHLKDSIFELCSH